MRQMNFWNILAAELHASHAALRGLPWGVYYGEEQIIS